MELIGRQRDAAEQQQCGRHALNNLFQEAVFTRAALNELSARLAERDREGGLARVSYHNMLGNFDVAVLVEALAQRGQHVLEYLHAAPAGDADQALEQAKLSAKLGALNLETMLGFLVNRGGMLGNHWFAIRLLADGMFYTLDSKAKYPARIGDGTRDALHAHILEELNAGCTVLAVGPATGSPATMP